jgi:hypothetical protein
MHTNWIGRGGNVTNTSYNTNPHTTSIILAAQSSIHGQQFFNYYFLGLIK